MKKSTEELLELMKRSYDYKDYLKENKEDINGNCMKIDRAVNMVIAEKKLKRADVIAKSGIEPHYAYQILSGKKNPTRDKAVMLCFGLGFGIEETQKLLRITGYAELYSKDERDNVFLFGLMKKLSVIDVNAILGDLGFEFLL